MLDGGNVGNTLISTVGFLSAGGVNHQEDGLAVSIVGSLSASHVGLVARGQGEGVSAVLQNEGATSIAGLRVSNQSQVIDLIAVNDIGHDVELVQLVVCCSGNGGVCTGGDIGDVNFHGLNSAVGEQQLCLVGVVEVAGGSAVVQNDSVLSGNVSVDVQAIAILVQINGDIVALINGSSESSDVGSGDGVAVDLLANGNGTGSGIAGHSAGDLLSQLHGLDSGHVSLLGVGVTNDVVLSELVGLEVANGGNASGLGKSVTGVQNDISVHSGGLGTSSSNLGNIGVDNNDTCAVGVSIIVDLSQSAVATNLVGDVAANDIIGGPRTSASNDSAVHVNDGILVSDALGQTQIGIDGANLNSSRVGQVSSLSIGTNGLALDLPGGSGTLKSIGISLALQVGEVLLSELHVAVASDVAIGLAVVLNNLSLGTSNGHVANGDGGVILNHVSIQSVESIQAGLFTGQSLGANESVNQTVVQADVQSTLGNLDGPVSAGVALDGSVIAQSAQQHLHEGIAGQRCIGTEGAVSITGDDALLCAVSNITSIGVVDGNVLVGSGVSGQSGCGGGAQDHVADDLSSGTTGQASGGIEGAVSIAANDANCGHHVDSFFIIDRSVIGEVLGTGADGDQRHGHNQSQNQRKELLHSGFPPFKFSGNYRHLCQNFGPSGVHPAHIPWLACSSRSL